MRFLSSHLLPGGLSDWQDDLDVSLPAEPPRAEAPGELPENGTLRVGATEFGPGQLACVREGERPPHCG